MGPRLILLILLGAGLALYYGTRTPAAPDIHVEVEILPSVEPNLLLWNYDLPGDQPVEPPDLELTLSVDPADGKQRIYFTLSEANDFYVETFILEFWYLTDADTEFEESPIQIEHYVDNYIKAGEVLESCLEVVDAELAEAGVDMGTIDNWAGRITGRGPMRYRTADPPDLKRENMPGCD
ncbi:MAG: hypothetical protein IH987_10455 [Planctomycetes bacterium]|nr:hypothetical protein [Planctomycetota bacterium]